jgi:hypothetical protein
MHIAQLLDAFPFRPDIEIVKPLLPDVSRGIAEQTALRRLTFPLLPRQDASRKPSFKACITVDGFFSSGSLTRRWMCSGMTT